MIGYLNFYPKGSWAKALLGEEAVVTNISLKKGLFGHFLQLGLCSCSDMIMEWSFFSS